MRSVTRIYKAGSENSTKISRHEAAERRLSVMGLGAMERKTYVRPAQKTEKTHVKGWPEIRVESLTAAGHGKATRAAGSAERPMA